MQKLKRIGATLVGSLMASSAVLAGALAADLSAFKDMTTADTVVVVGANAKTADVVGAINVAAALARHGAEATVTGGGEVTKVTNGVALETESEKVYLFDTIDKAKEALTSDDLPNLLASGTVTDDSGEDYDYDQYIYIGNAQVVAGKPESDMDPIVYVDFDTETLYTLKIVFNDEINFSDEEVQGNTIKLFGKEYTIAQDDENTNTHIILYEASQEVTVAAGQETTVTIDGKEYTVSVTGISETPSATIVINGKSYTKEEGDDITIGDVVFHVKEINLYKVPEETGNVVLTVGTKKIILEDDSAVKVGKDEDTVDGTHVTITPHDGSPVSRIEIKVTAPSDDEDYIPMGGEFVDPVLGFKVKFKDNTAEVLPTADEIAVSTSGDDKATVKFTDKRGNTKTVTFAYHKSGESDVDLLNDDKEQIMTYEGEEIPEDGYLVISQKDGDFAHILKVKDIDTSDDELELEDVLTGTTYEIDYGDDNWEVKVIDGYEYNFTIDEGEKKVSVKRNDADEIKVFPTIKLRKGEELAFVKDIELNNTVGGTPQNGDTVVLPGNCKYVYDGTEWKNESSNAPYCSVIYTVNSDGTIKILGKDNLQAGILIIEEKDDDENKGAVLVPVWYDNGDDKQVEVQEPVYETFVGAPVLSTNPPLNGGFETWESDDDIKSGLTRWGTYIKVDTEDQGEVTIMYPDEQVYYTVAIGPDPQFGGTVSTGAAEMTFPALAGTGIAALDTEASQYKGAKNIILVGGPAANQLVAELAQAGKTPTFEEWQAKLQGKAIIQAIDNPFGGDKVAIVVAGWSADDTRAACLKLATEELSGTAKMLVNGELADFEYPFPAEEEAAEGETSE